MVGIPRTCSLRDLSFPRTRESRFVLRRISLDTRVRGYDGAPEVFVVHIIPTYIFSKKVRNNCYDLRGLGGELSFGYMA